MENINSHINLAEQIKRLEQKQLAQNRLLKAQLHIVFESIKPINIIKSAFSDISESKDLKENIIDTSMAMASGYVTKKIFEHGSKNVFKRLLGTAIMFGVTTMVERHPDALKMIGQRIFNFVTNANRHHNNNGVNTH